MLLDIDRQNLQKLKQDYNYDFDYLRPDSNVYNVQQKQKDMYYWKDNQMKVKGRRRIYYNIQYTQEEENAIKQVQYNLAKQGIVIKFSKQYILKHLHVQKLGISGTISRLRQIQNFYYSQMTNLKDKTIQNLNRGFIYTFGYTKDYRPLLIFRVDKINFDMEVQDIFNALYYLMIVLVQYKMKPFHSQKYVIILDLNNMNIGQIPKAKMYTCLTKLSLYTCGYTDQNFVVNAAGIWSVWMFVKTFLPEYAVKKVIFLDNMKPLLDIVDADELQQRYGGKRANIEDGQFWPPVISKKCEDFTNKQESEELQDTFYYSVHNDDTIFKDGYIDLTKEVVNAQKNGCCSSQCKIY